MAWGDYHAGRKVRVRLRWLAGAAGASHVVRGRFSTPARFKHQDEAWTSNAWSVVVEPVGPESESREQDALAWFLVPNEPQQWLAPGARFELHAGRAIAEGQVLEVVAE